MRWGSGVGAGRWQTQASVECKGQQVCLASSFRRRSQLEISSGRTRCEAISGVEPTTLRPIRDSASTRVDLKAGNLRQSVLKTMHAPVCFTTEVRRCSLSNSIKAVLLQHNTPSQSRKIMRDPSPPLLPHECADGIRLRTSVPMRFAPKRKRQLKLWTLEGPFYFYLLATEKREGQAPKGPTRGS